MISQTILSGSGEMEQHIVKQIDIQLNSNEEFDRGYFTVIISTSDSERLLTIRLENTDIVTENKPGCETISIEELPISVAIALRDFLNYALPGK
jgi:hypothetical protein